MASASRSNKICFFRKENVNKTLYVVVVMENYAMGDEATTAMKEVTRTLYDYFWRLGNTSRYGTYVGPGLIK